MGKKSRGKKPSAPAARPSAGEAEGLIAFLQQLMREQRYPEALRAGRTLVENYPLNPLAHAVLGSVLAQLNNPQESIRQFELAERLGMDRDPMLLQSLAVASSSARYPVHALRTARQGAQIKTATPEQRQAFDTIIRATESYITDLIGRYDVPRHLAEEALLLMERSARALFSRDNERARRLAEEATETAPTWPVIWNHLATLLFQFNDVPGAIAACTHVLTEVDAQNPVMLATLVRLYAVTGRGAEAQDPLDRLLAVPHPDVAAIEEIGKGLAILSRDQDVYAQLSAYPQGEEGGLHPVGRYLLGVAAANVGKLEEARIAWRNLWREGLTQARIFADIISRHEPPPTPDGRFTYFAASELVPTTVLDELATQVHPNRDTARLAAIARDFPRLPEALCETFYASGVDPRLAIDLLLELGTDQGITNAIRTFAISRAAGDYNRVYAHIALRGAGLEDAASPASVWIGGRRRDLVLPALRLVPPADQGYSPEIRQLFVEGAEAQERDDTEAALGVYRRILEIDPDAAEAEHNLGTALLLASRIDEGEPHLRRALEIDRDHVLARCNLASLALMRGDLPAAHEMLDPLEGRETFALEELVAYLRTRSDLARADGDPVRAETLLYALLAYDPDNELAQERLAGLTGTPMSMTG